MGKKSIEPAASLEEVLQSFRLCLPLFGALGDKSRQDIIMLLAENGRLNVTAITERMHLSRPAVSHHLKVLLHAGLVTVERESRENYYAPALDEGLGMLKKLVLRAESSCL